MVLITGDFSFRGVEGVGEKGAAVFWNQIGKVNRVDFFPHYRKFLAATSE